MNEIITVKNLSKHFERNKKKVFALRNVSISIQKGDIYGVIGLSGAGKSTLIRCLAQLTSPNQGEIYFYGTPFSTMHKTALRQFRKKMGMVFQHFHLMTARTVAENIAYPLEIAHIPKESRQKRVKELLQLIGLSNKARAYPAQLSGGEKQRVGIARALANQIEILLCDEATSALDPKTTQDILQLLRQVNSDFGITIVLITHEMEVIKQICNQVAIVEQGEIIEQGTVADIFSHPSHTITKQLLQNSPHHLPLELLTPCSSERKLLQLGFKGDVAKEAIISDIIHQFDVKVNILLGWIDRAQNTHIGSLVIELTGSAQGVCDALQALKERGVYCEVVKHEC